MTVPILWQAHAAYTITGSGYTIDKDAGTNGGYADLLRSVLSWNPNDGAVTIEVPAGNGVVTLIGFRDVSVAIAGNDQDVHWGWQTDGGVTIYDKGHAPYYTSSPGAGPYKVVADSTSIRFYQNGTLVRTSSSAVPTQLEVVVDQYGYTDQQVITSLTYPDKGTFTMPIAVSTDDGFARYSDTVYPPVATGTVNDSAANTFAGKVFSSPTYQNTVNLLRWDTSFFMGKEILTGLLREWVHTHTNDDGAAMVMKTDWYTAGATIATSDYNNAPSGNANSKALSAINNAAYNDFALTSPDANTNKSGYTGLRQVIDGSAPAGDNTVQIHTFENTSAHIPPQLIYTYQPAAVTLPIGVALFALT